MNNVLATIFKPNSEVWENSVQGTHRVVTGKCTLFKSLTTERSDRTMRQHYHLHTAAAIPHYDYQPKNGLTRISNLPTFRNRLLTLSLSIVILSMAWLLNQPSNASYSPQPTLLPPLSLANVPEIKAVDKVSAPPPQTTAKITVKSTAHSSLDLSKNEDNLKQILSSTSSLVDTNKSDKSKHKASENLSKRDGVLELRVKSGDNLSLIFDRHGLNRKQLHKFLSIKKHKKSLRQLHLGQKIEIQHQENGDIDALKLSLDARHDLLISKPEQQEQFLATVLDKPITIETISRTVTIKNSLISDAKKAGLPHKLTFQLAEVFGWDVDFSLGLKKGDHFTVLYEQHFSSEGDKIGFGHILAAEIHNQGKVYQAIRYTDKKGKARYYNGKGQIMEKTFLRSPVKAGFISSKFNLRRRHPVLNTIRAHKGVDYAAPRGTPIYATANGVIKFKGYRNGYGKTVEVDHGSGYETLFAHMSRYAKHLKKGKRIRQGELIGYVGSTGLASGPHLHYEFHHNGKVKNPLTIKFPSTLTKIAASERTNFKKHASTLLAQLAEGTTVASK